MSTHHNGDKIGTLVMPRHQEVQMVSCAVCRKAKGRVLSSKRVALGKSQTVACLDVSLAFLHAEMKDEVHIEMGADTLSFDT